MPSDGRSMRGLLDRVRNSEVVRQFMRSPAVVGSAFVIGAYVLAAIFAPFVAPHNPFDPASLHLSEAFMPPVWLSGGSMKFLLGTDGQGRDILSSMIYGARVSLIVGMCAVVLAMVVGVVLGLFAGYLGGWIDVIVMRLVDMQLTIPAILVALMIDGIARAVVSGAQHEGLVIYILIFAIGISDWPRFAHLTRGAALVERHKDYVSAADAIGVRPLRIMFRHVLPNVTAPIMVLATIGLALAIITEATLSFLGVGLPPTQPSLGTMIRTGNGYLFSGEWWIILFPSLALVILVLAINVLGDWLRETLDPKLR